MSSTITEDVHHFGVPVRISAPPAAQTVDITSRVAREQGSVPISRPSAAATI